MSLEEAHKNVTVATKKNSYAVNETVMGYDWNHGINFEKCLNSFKNTGFQATNFGISADIINEMIDCRNQSFVNDSNTENDDFIYRRNNCTIFLGYTSNMVSCGVRESIRFLVQHNYVDCIVTTAGGIEEDFIKCLMPTLIGSFDLDGAGLRDSGLNRIGNLLVPNENYCAFEDWIKPIFEEMYQEQIKNNIIWTPSKMIAKLGEKINNPNSIYFWAWKNKIPVFCPALTDGSLGDMLFFYSFNRSDFILDILSDLRKLNMMSIKALNTGIIILGGGIVKHHICNANLMRNGADYAVFINTGSDYDGSDSGARPDESVSWGKLKKHSKNVKIHADASLIFPLLVGQTFANFHFKKNDK